MSWEADRAGEMADNMRYLIEAEHEALQAVKRVMYPSSQDVGQAVAALANYRAAVRASLEAEIERRFTPIGETNADSQ